MSSSVDQINLDLCLAQVANPLDVEVNVDAVNQLVHLMRDDKETIGFVLRFFSHKIQSPHESEALKALNVIQTLVKRADKKFFDEVGKFRFINEMVKIISPKHLATKSPEKVKKKTIELLYLWSIELKHEPKIANQAFQMLKEQGIITSDQKPMSPEMKPMSSSPKSKDEIWDTAEMLKLKRLIQSGHPEDRVAANKMIKMLAHRADRKADIKSRCQTEMELARNNVHLFCEVFASFKSSQEGNFTEKDLLDELYDSCKKLRPKLFKLAGELPETDPFFEEILKVNDELTKMINEYDVKMHSFSLSSERSLLPDIKSQNDLLSDKSPIKSASKSENQLSTISPTPLKASTSSLHILNETYHATPVKTRSIEINSSNIGDVSPPSDHETSQDNFDNSFHPTSITNDNQNISELLAKFSRNEPHDGDSNVHINRLKDILSSNTPKLTSNACISSLDLISSPLSSSSSSSPSSSPLPTASSLSNQDSTKNISPKRSSCRDELENLMRITLHITDQVTSERDRLERDLRRTAEDYTRRIESLKDELEEANIKKCEIADEKNFLNIQLRQMEEEKLTLAKTLQLTNDKLTALNYKFDEHKQENSELRRLVEWLEQDKELKRDEINNLKRKLETVESELEVCRRDLSDSQASLTQEEKANEKLAKDLQDTSQTLKESEKSRSELKKEVKQLRTIKNKLENELADKRAEVEELNQTIEKKTEKEQARLDEANKEKALLAETEAEKQMAKKENVSLKHRISELEHLLKLEKNTSKKKEEEIKRLDSVKTNLETKLTESSEEVFIYQKNNKDLEVKFQSIESQLNRLTEEKKEIEEQFVKLNSVLRSCLKLGNVSLNESEITFDEIVPAKNRKSYLVSSLIDTELLDAEFVRSAIIDLLSKVETLSKERDDLQSAVDQAQQLSSSLKESNRILKGKLEKLETDWRQLEKDNKNMSRKIEELNGITIKLEESLAKCNAEKKSLTLKIDALTNLNDKLEKEKRKLTHEYNSLRSSKTSADKDLTELRERYEGKIKKLETTKDSLDARVSSLIKMHNQLIEEKESLLSELKMVNSKLIELQNHNYKLHSALNEANLALKRCSDGEKDLQKKVNNLTDSVEQQDAASKDVNKQIRKLKDQVQELKSEKSTLLSTIESDRHNSTQMKEALGQLQLRIKQLEAELNLSNIKRKEAEFQQTILTNGNIDKEAKIKDLKSELTSLEERYKQLMINQRCSEKTYSVSSINRLNTNKIKSNEGSGRESEKGINVTLETSSFADDTDLTAKGLKALEEENIKLQKKVESLQDFMNEAANVSPNVDDLSLLREAQKQAENILSAESNQSEKGETIRGNNLTIMTTPVLKKYSRSDLNNGHNGNRNSGSIPSSTTTTTAQAGQTRGFRTSSRTIQECTRTERTQITSTPISSSSIYRLQHKHSTSPRRNVK